jgi:hypothetical protein
LVVAALGALGVAVLASGDDAEKAKAKWDDLFDTLERFRNIGDRTIDLRRQLDQLEVARERISVADGDFDTQKRLVQDAADAEIAGLLPAATPRIEVWNKADTVAADDGAAGPAGALALSAKTGAGLEALRANPLEASAPATRVDIPDVEPEAVEKVEEEEETEETEETEEAEAEEEARESEDAKETEEAEEAEDAPLARTLMATEEDVGGTCLIVNLMIGIGNKPFVRGSGPGLSEEVGEPMQFLAIGRWLWRAPVGGTAVTVQVWKNDKSPLGEAVYIRAGESRELDEAFFAG